MPDAPPTSPPQLPAGNGGPIERRSHRKTGKTGTCSASARFLSWAIRMATSGTKVLLVDDDLLIREIYGRHLMSAGFQVLPALNAAEALELAQREQPKVIVLDINLAGTSGLAALRDLQSQESTRTIPVIMITSAADYRTCREFSQAANAAAFLTKPFSPRQLLAEIEKALGDGKAEAEG